MSVSLFVTCLTDTLFPETGRATVRVLERLGCEVRFPAAQTCCGQMHANAGYVPEAQRLLRRFVAVFEDAEQIVTPSGSCAAMVREQYPRLAAETGDPGLVRAVASVSARVSELSRFLDSAAAGRSLGAVFPHRVAFHHGCHALRALPDADAPRRLLANVEGLELVALPDEEQCCGFGGAFAVKNPDVSSAMLAAKLAAIKRSGAEVCTSTDDSCLMHIRGALQRSMPSVRAVHIAEVLASTGAEPQRGAPSSR